MTPGAFVFFTSVWNVLVPPILAAEQPIIAALQSFISGWFVIAVTAYLMAMLLIAAYTPGEEGITRFFRQLFLAGVVWSIAATTGGFSLWVLNFATGLVTSVNTAVVGSFGGTAITGPGSFDAIANQMVAVGAVTMKHVPWYAIVRGIGMLLLVDLYIIASIVVIALMFILFMLSSVILSFLLMFGPIFVVCYMFPFSRQFCDGWVRAVVAAMITMIFITGITTLFSTVVTAVITPITANLQSSSSSFLGDDTFGQVLSLMLLLVTCVIFFFLTVYVARLAQSIAGGAHAHFSRLPNIPGGGGGGGGGGRPPPTGGAPAGGGGGFGAAPAGGGGGGNAGRQYAFNRSVGSAP